MNYLAPIHTEKTRCEDCYKCVRNCPVKAIKVEGSCATIIAEACILCGNCVSVCPNSAKRVRDDLHRARQLIASRDKVIVSLAPSYVAAFADLKPAQVVAALRKLGFAGVSETALGAQQVSAHCAQLLSERPGQVLISSACPTVVLYLQRHDAEQAKFITPLLSPLLAHCKLLRQVYGDGVGIVFIGPCIAKKFEADKYPQLLDVALTFDDLRRWLEEARIHPSQLKPTPEDRFVPEAATDGAIYPVDGGMIAGIRADCRVNDCAFMSFSGISAIEKALEGIEHLPLERGLMLELLACEGGCINGPAMGGRGATAAKRYRVLRNGYYDPIAIPRQPGYAIDADWSPTPVQRAEYPEARLREVLTTVGKYSIDDELNCGGCGYDSCRDFAVATLEGKAERAMCVTYMRQLAHKKADALIQKMPSAVVIVNAGMKVVECNGSFAALCGGRGPGLSTSSLGGEGRGEGSAGAGGVMETSRVSAPKTPHPNPLPQGERGPEVRALEGRELASLVPFHRLFAGVLKTGEDIVDRDLRYRDTILHLSIFSIEKHALVGGIIQDITKPAVQKEQVIRKAREVIQKNLATVQKIAYLLGENAAESEITLNSIIESFTPAGIEDAARSDAAAQPTNPTTQDVSTDRTKLGKPASKDDWRDHYRR
jgi:iron only hydrogenase large subunit-like protein